MSGGHFDYNYYQIDMIVDSIENELHIQGKEKPKDELYNTNEFYEKYPEELIYPTYSKIVNQKLKEAIRQLKIASVYAKRVDYFLSGDSSEDSFILQLEEELNILEQNKI